MQLWRIVIRGGSFHGQKRFVACKGYDDIPDDYKSRMKSIKLIDSSVEVFPGTPPSAARNCKTKVLIVFKNYDGVRCHAGIHFHCSKWDLDAFASRQWALVQYEDGSLEYLPTEKINRLA